MHATTLNEEIVNYLYGIKCWDIGLSEIDRLAFFLSGKNVSFVRKGNVRALVAGLKFASAASKLPEELRLLSESAARIQQIDADHATIIAAAYFHLKFENIHPLLDFNGRVGRLLMAEQCRRSYGIPLKDFINHLFEMEIEYKAIFGVGKNSLRFDLLCHLLSRIVSVSLPGDICPPCSLSPVFPERSLYNFRPAKV